MADLEDQFRDMARRRALVRKTVGGNLPGALAAGFTDGPLAARAVMRDVPQATERPATSGLTDAEALDFKLQLQDKMNELRALEQDGVTSKAEIEKEKQSLRLEMYKAALKAKESELGANATVSASRNAALSSTYGNLMDMNKTEMLAALGVSNDEARNVKLGRDMMEQIAKTLSPTPGSDDMVMDKPAADTFKAILTELGPVGRHLMKLEIDAVAKTHNVDSSRLLAAMSRDSFEMIKAASLSEQVGERVAEAVAEQSKDFQDEFIKELRGGVKSLDVKQIMADVDAALDGRDDELARRDAASSEQGGGAGAGDGGDGGTTLNPDYERLAAAFDDIASDEKVTYNPTLRTVREDLVNSAQFKEFQQKNGLPDQKIALRQLASQVRAQDRTNKEISRQSRANMAPAKPPIQTAPAMGTGAITPVPELPKAATLPTLKQRRKDAFSDAIKPK